MSRSTATSGGVGAIIGAVAGSVALATFAVVWVALFDRDSGFSLRLVFVVVLAFSLVLTVIPAIVVGLVLGAIGRPRLALLVGPLAGALIGLVTRTTFFTAMGCSSGLVAALVFLRVEPTLRPDYESGGAG